MIDKAMIDLLAEGTLESLYMTLGASALAYLIGLPMGIVLVVTGKDGIKPFRPVYEILNVIVNFVRSVPFLILLIAIIPLARFLVGTSIGPKAVTVGLVIAAAPFVARLVESSLKEVDKGIIEAAQSMGASHRQIVFKVMLVEALPSIFVGAAIAVTTILSYSAMAGIMGGGGLGDVAIRYGYYKYDTGIMMITVVLLVILVQILQEAGMRIAKKVDKRLL